MRKNYLLLGVCLSICTMMNAQQFGVKAGINTAKFYGGDVDKSMVKVGFHFGGFFNSKISKKTAFQPELLFSSQGAKFSDGATAATATEGQIMVNYITVPLMFQWYLTTKFNVELGPQLGFLTSSKYKITKLDGATVNRSGKLVDLEDVKKVSSFDAGLSVGLGYHFTNNLSFNTRYYLGLFSDVVKIDEAPLTKDEALVNGVFQIGLAYRF